MPSNLALSSYDDMAREELAARLWAFDATGRSSDSGERPSLIPDVRARLDTLLAVLRTVIASAAVHEAVDELGLVTWRDAQEQGAIAVRRADYIAGFEVTPVLTASRRRPSNTHPLDEKIPLRIEQMVSLANTVVGWPIDDVEALANAVGASDIGHALRVGHRWLRAFLQRHTAGDNRGLRVVARAYSDGRLSIEEVAAVFDGSIPDALAWLDANGFKRSVQTMQMTDEERTTAFAKLRADRLRRGDKPAPREELIERDALATQRIEDVDARPWLRRSTG